MQPFLKVAFMSTFILTSGFLLPLDGQVVGRQPFFPGESGYEATDRPASNSAVDFLVRGDTLWVAGGKGLSWTTDRGATWKNFTNVAPFGEESIAALDAHGAVFWASLAGSIKVGDEYLPVGKGLAFSTDNGGTWQRIDQPMEPGDMKVYQLQYGDNKIDALAVTVDVNNITYDLAVTSDAVWIASFAGGLRKSTDMGATWQPVILPPDHLDSIAPEDTLDFDLSPVNRPDLGLTGNLNHRVFSVMAESDSVIWVGTAGGINLTTDGGISWRKFNATNQDYPISGNFVVAIAENVVNGRKHIWAATVNALDLNEFRAVSVSSDGGASWLVGLRGVFAHGFGVRGERVYTGTDDGLYCSQDGGRSWSGNDRFVDPSNRQRITNPNTYAVAFQAGDLWAATEDGLVRSTPPPDGCYATDWTVFRAAQPSTSLSDVYAYPNPFAPDDEVCRIHYRVEQGSSVTVQFYGFGMTPVRTLVRNAPRNSGREYDEIWDGRDDSGQQVANGVYFYRVQVGENDPAWGKVIVLQ